MERLHRSFSSRSVLVLFSLVFFCVLGTPALPVEFEFEYRYPLPADILGIALTPDDQTLFVAYWNDTPDNVAWYDASAPYAFKGSYHYGWCHGDCVTSMYGETVYFPTYYSDDLSAYDIDTGTHTTLGTTSWPGTVVRTPDHSRAIVFGGMDGRTSDLDNDALCVYDIAEGAFSHVTDILLDDEPVGQKMAFSSDGNFGYFLTRTKWSSEPSKVYEVDLNSLSISRVVPLPTDDHAHGIALAGDRLFVADSEFSLIRVFDRTTLTEIDQWPMQWTTGTDDRVTLAVPLDESGLYVVSPSGPNGGALTVRAIDTGAVLGGWDDLGLDTPRDIEFTSDSRRVFIPGHQGGGVVVLNRIAPQYDLLIYEEYFANDPTWITNIPSNYYWDPVEEAFRVINVKDTNFGYYFTNVPTVQGSFRMVWDQKVTRDDWGSHLGLGFHENFADFPDSEMYTRTLFQNPDSGRGVALHWKTGPVAGSDDLYQDFVLDEWYHFVLTYDAASLILEARVYEGKGPGGPFWGSRVKVLDEPLPGLSEIGDSLEGTVPYGTTFEGFIDNVKLYACAPFLTQSDLVGGQKAWFLTAGANSGEMVYFGYSLNGTDPGFDCPAFGGLHIDLNQPAGELGRDEAEFPGIAVIQRFIPAGFVGLEVATQAAIYRGQNGEDSVKTNFVTTVISP